MAVEVAPVEVAAVEEAEPTASADLDQALMARFSHDQFFSRVVRGLTDPAFRHELSNSWRRRLTRFTVTEGKLWMREEGGDMRQCVPMGPEREVVMREYHDTLVGGHAGVGKMYGAMRLNFFWPKMLASVSRYVRRCDSCQRNKAVTATPRAPAQPLPTPHRPWATISMDYMDLPMTTSGHDCVLTVVDAFSNMAHFIPTTRSVNTEGTVDLLLNSVVRLHGVPSDIVSDRDSRFTSAVWTGLWERMGTTLRMSTAHRPQSDGRSERSNRTIQQHLRAFVNASASDWDAPATLSLIELGINYRINPTTGVSPFQAVQGYNPCIPATLEHPHPPMATPSVPSVSARFEELKRVWGEVKAHTLEAQQRQREAHPSPLMAQPSFPVGTRVLLSTANYPSLRLDKLHSPFVGPFKVLARPSVATAILELPPTWRMHNNINIQSLKEYHEPPPAAEPPGPVGTTSSGELLWRVEEVLGERKRRGRTQFKVRWRGFDPSHDSWEPEGEIRRVAPRLVREFRETVVPHQSRNRNAG